MDTTMLMIGLLVGVILGAVLAWSWGRTGLLARAASAESERDVLRSHVAQLETARADDEATRLLLAPLRDTVVRVERQVGVLERDRAHQFGELSERLLAVGASTESLRSQTASLASALNASSVRGAWGELQLRRVLELSGLLPRCDFAEQVSAVSRHGASIRPDAVVNLPGGRHVVIDSKAPMTQFLRAQGDGVADTERTELLAAHATALRRHVESLAAKSYWTAFERSPEVVVCFVPGEAVLGAALARDPGLYEHALTRNVVLASPGTLFAVLRTIGAIWQQQALEQHARELLRLGQELHARLTTLGKHVSGMGQSLAKSVEQYNRFVGTLESRVMVTARRMRELELNSEQEPCLEPVTNGPRTLSVPELVEATDSTATTSDNRDAAFLAEQVSRADDPERVTRTA